MNLKANTVKVLLVFGTRPEAIKMAPVVKTLQRHREKFLPVACVTAQHREMLDQVLSLFEVVPDYDLNIMAPGQSLADITKKAVEGLDNIIAHERPDMVLVQGDTTTAFCGALAAFYNRVKVGHVEAGLRTDNRYSPFPEEINRRLVTQLADCHFAPTEYAALTLRKEGVQENAIYTTGNTVIDALLWMREKVQRSTPEIPEGLDGFLDGRPTVLITGHRRESFGEGFENICRAVREVADGLNDVVFVYPVHLNPNVQEPVNRILGGHDRILLIEPLSYAPFVWLMDRATVVLTDSGGIQEEAPSLGKPVLVMRETTERPEGIEAGNARLVGTRKDSIAQGLMELLQNSEIRNEMAKKNNPYGDGKASERIVDILARELGGN